MKKIAIVHGEPNSINSEIIFKSWLKFKSNKKKIIFIIGNKRLIEEQYKKLRLKAQFHEIDEGFLLKKNKINILNVEANFNNPFKLNLKETKAYVLKSIKKAHNLSIEGKVNGFINCPINKNIFTSKIGVTEYIAKENNVLGKEVMLIYNDFFSVAPLTTHINLKHVVNKLRKLNIRQKIIEIDKFYKKKFGKAAKIAILGLNPHNDEMRKSSFEKKILSPLIQKLHNNGLKVVGPLSVDNIFLKNRIEYDVVVGMYHDQVLGPFKALQKFNGINITLGLKYLRASPDHGTSVDLIFERKANPQSLINCIDFL